MVRFLCRQMIFVVKMINKNLKNNRGFTLVEMMVSVAIFSIVVMIALGAILTILDANRKARTLTEVMSNLNFSVEMITRSLKTGVEPNYQEGILSVGAIVLDEEGFKREKTRYKLSVDNSDPDNSIGQIIQCVDKDYTDNNCDADTWVPVTSESVDVDKFEILVVGTDTEGLVQPRTQIIISGTVKVSEKISSSFSLQTSVSQRRLNILGSELDLE